jgi:thiol-disulfide isomerase/thioredoxin
MLTNLKINFFTILFAFSTFCLGQNVSLNLDKSDTIIKIVNLEDFQNEFSTKPFLTKSKNNSENLNLEFSLATPNLFRFSSLQPQTASLIVLATPGDEINYKLDNNNQIIFEGQNASHYNFFRKLNNSQIKYPIFNENDGIWNYKKNTQLTYEKRIQFFEEYVKNEKVSQLFKEKMRTLLEFEYINWLLNRFIIPENAIDDYQKYLSDINVKTFDRVNQEDNAFYFLALTNFLHINSKIITGEIGYTSKNLNYQLDFIDKNFIGTTKEYAITKTLLEFENHLKSEYLVLLKNKVTEKLPLITDNKYKIILEKLSTRLANKNLLLPEEVLNSELIQLDGTKISLNQVLQKHGKKIKIIDFWASWCAPCIEEIKNSSDLRNKVTKDDNFEFIYFSIDKNVESWKKKVANLEKFGMHKNQYLVVENSTSAFATYFNLQSIPRYAIIDSTNTLLSINETSPKNLTDYNTLLKEIQK